MLLLYSSSYTCSHETSSGECWCVRRPTQPNHTGTSLWHSHCSNTGSPGSCPCPAQAASARTDHPGLAWLGLNTCPQAHGEGADGRGNDPTGVQQSLGLPPARCWCCCVFTPSWHHFHCCFCQLHLSFLNLWVQDINSVGAVMCSSKEPRDGNQQKIEILLQNGRNK